MGKRLPPGITKRGDAYRVSIMVSGVRRTATRPTLAEAEQVAADFRSGAVVDQKAPAWRLDEAGEAFFLDHVCVNATSEGSRQAQKSRIKVVVDRLTDQLGADAVTDDVDRAAVVALTAGLSREGREGTYINALLSTLQSVLKHAWVCRRRSTPPPEMGWVKVKAGRIRFVTDEEEARMLQWAEHHALLDYGDLLVLLLDTGMRVGEALAMQWRDVDLVAETAHIWKSKSKEPRAVPLTRRVRAILSRRRQANPQGPKVMAGVYETYRRRWDQMREALGLDEDPDFTIHVLRHTCCTRLVSAGVDLRTVQRWMGHENIETTMRYAQFVPKNLFAAVSALEGRGQPKLRSVG